MLRNSILDKMTFKKRLDGSERVSHRETWRRSILGRENSRCKGPEADWSWWAGLQEGWSEGTELGGGDHCCPGVHAEEAEEPQRSEWMKPGCTCEHPVSIDTRPARAAVKCPFKC